MKNDVADRIIHNNTDSFALKENLEGFYKNARLNSKNYYVYHN